MAKKVILEITEKQFEALIDIIDESSAQIGCGDDDELRVRRIKLLDKMLLKNGYKREFK